MKLDRFGADFPIVHRHGSNINQLKIVGSDGSEQHFLLQNLLSPISTSDEQIIQLFRVLNKWFVQHKE